MPRISTPIPIPPPWQGMNTREGISSLQPAEARYLENWNPEGSSVKPRKGYVVTSSGGQSSNPVETLAAYDGLTVQHLIGVNGGSIWDFSSATAILLSSSGFTDSRFQTECYNNRLIGVNGSDTPWTYNGSTIAATGFSGAGLTLSNLVNIRKVRNRLWFCENDSADVWYGGIGSITGALTKFTLSQVVGGGACMAIGAHSQDAGDGPDDYTVFVMDTGEAVLYSGDPSTTFTKVGNYFMPKPVGRQCLVNVGGPLAVLTNIGLVPLQAAVTGVAFDVLALGNYGKIGPSIKADVASYGDNEGWHAVVHEGRVIINVPVSTTVSRQYVYNSQTGAWTIWTGHNASALCVQGGLFYGLTTDGRVHQVTGPNDAGTGIDTIARCAFNTSNGREVKVTAARFDIKTDGSLTGRFGLDTDYIDRDISGYTSQTLAQSVASTEWGSDWGSDWSTANQYGGQWFGAYAEGQAVGLNIEAEVLASNLEWLGSYLLTRPTGI